MLSSRQSASAAAQALPVSPVLLTLGVLVGCLAVVVGTLQFDLIAQIRPEQVAKHGFVLLLLMAGGQMIARLSGKPFALGLLASFLLMSAVVIGPAPLIGASVLLVCAASLALLLFGSVSSLPLPARLAAGLALLAMVIGWTLPLPIHFRFVYLLIASVLVVPRRHALLEMGQQALDDLERAVRRRPGFATLAMLSLVGTAVAAWLPTLAHDDLGYHLILPSQLQQLGYYRMDAASQVWAFAPWLGDCLFGIAQVLAGEDARGSVNLIWLACLASLLFSLTRRLWPDDDRPAWIAVALYVGLPINAVLMLGMQTELFGTVLLLAAVSVLLAHVDSPDERLRLICFVLLVAGLALTKTSMLPFAVLLLVWFGWRRRLALSRRTRFLMLPAVVLGGGSAYFYGYVFTGNPVLPLANAFFQSPYFPLSNLANARYLSPLDLTNVWALLFDSGRFYESRAGVSGFHWLPLLVPALIAAWRVPALRALMLIGVAVAAVIFSAQSYLRYLMPAFALLIPAYAVGASLLPRRLGIGLLIVLVGGNFVFQTHASWILSSSTVFREFTGIGRDSYRNRIAPERTLLPAALSEGPDVRVLLAASGQPFTADAAGRAFTISWYDSELHHAHREGGSKALTALLSRYLFTHVITHDAFLTQAERDELHELGATKLLRVERAVLWRVPDLPGERVDLFTTRDRSLPGVLGTYRERYRQWHRERKLRNPERYQEAAL